MLSNQVNHQLKAFIPAKSALAGATLFLRFFVKNLLTMAEPTILPCGDKLAFDSEKEALDQARVIKWQRDTKLKAYRCRYCQLWHLSSNL